MSAKKTGWTSWNRDGMNTASERNSSSSVGPASSTSQRSNRTALVLVLLGSILLAVSLWVLLQNKPSLPSTPPAAVSPADHAAWTQALHAWSEGVLLATPTAPIAPAMRTRTEPLVAAADQWRAQATRQSLVTMLDNLSKDSIPWWNQSQQQGEAGRWVAPWTTTLWQATELRRLLASDDWLRRYAQIEEFRAQIDASLRAYAASPESQQASSLGQAWRTALAHWFADPQQTAWTSASTIQKQWQDARPSLLEVANGWTQAVLPPPRTQVAPTVPIWPLVSAIVSWLFMIGGVVVLIRSGVPGKGWSEGPISDALAGHVADLLDDGRRVTSGDLGKNWRQRPTALAPLVDMLNDHLKQWREHVEKAKELANEMHQKSCDISDFQQGMMEKVGVNDTTLSKLAEWAQDFHQGSLTTQGDLATLRNDIDMMVAHGQDSAKSLTLARKVSEQAFANVTETDKTSVMLVQDMKEMQDLSRTLRDVAEHLGVLAMQSALQAAKAGDSGKGFKMVAGEVQKTSLRAEEASVRVSALVENGLSNLSTLQASISKLKSKVDESRDVTEKGKDAVEGMGERIESIRVLAPKLEDQVAKMSVKGQIIQNRLSEVVLPEASTVTRGRCEEIISEMMDVARQSGENMSRFWTGKTS